MAKVEHVMESADTADAIRAHHRNVEAANDVILKGRRVSVKRRRSLLPTRANFWKEMINRSIFSGTQGDQTNLKADEEHVAIRKKTIAEKARNISKWSPGLRSVGESWSTHDSPWIIHDNPWGSRFKAPQHTKNFDP